jgi:Ca2+-binding EF-hand superfamily protein
LQGQNGLNCLKARREFGVSGAMNIPTTSLILVAALLPALAFAAKDGKTRKRPSADAAPSVPEVVKTYDKNGNHQIDPDELAALQKSFAELKKLDKNANGEIEAAEVAPPKVAAADTDRRARAMEGLKKVDKNGNGKIDADEIEGLQKALAGGRILERLDENKDGKLQSNEVERLNQHLAQGGLGAHRPASKASPPKSPGATPSASAATSSESSGAAKTDAAKPEAAKTDSSKPDAGKAAEPKSEAPTDLTKDPFLPKKDPFLPKAEGGAKPPSA